MKKIAKEVSSEAVSEVMQENQARAVVYNFLSSLFAKELNKDLVSQLTSTQGLRFLNSLALEKKLAPSINIISTQLTKLNSKQSLLELAADFCGLFLVDGRTSVSPYAGQYLSSKLNKVCSDELTSKKKQHKAQLFGDYHQLMAEFLTNSNMQIHSDFPEPADHISVMLAYLAHLSLSASKENQLSFIEVYLMTWLSDFTQQVKRHDPGCFYTALAELTFEWVKLDINN
jgi:TorA-specific chaperone